MSGVQDDIDCPQCGGHDTYTRDYRNRDSSWWELCSRCGCREGRRLMRSRRDITKARIKMKKLLEQYKLEEAAQFCLSEEHSNPTRTSMENFIKDKDSYPIYWYYKAKGWGAGSVVDEVNRTGWIEPLKTGRRRRKAQIKELLEMRSQCDVKITEVLEDGTLIEYL
jgi:hypothetical protein